MTARVSLLLIATAAGLWSQPFVFYRGVVNAASLAPPGLANGALARGSIFTIFGRDLGPAEGVVVDEFPLETTLAGVSIEVCQDQACLAAIPIFVRADQINAIMPSQAPLGPVSIRVSYDGEAGNFSPAEVAASSAGLFAINSAGFGPGILQDFVTAADQPVNSPEAAAHPGQVVTLWATGLGAGLNADNAAPEPGNLPVGAEIWVGGVPVTNILYAGRSPCCAGVDQIVFAIPAAAPQGCYVPVTVRTLGELVSNDVTMAISEDGSPCADAIYPAGAALRAGGNFGQVMLVHGRNASLPLQLGADVGMAQFSEERAFPWTYHPNLVGPPPGACLVTETRGASAEELLESRTSLRMLDAGEQFLVETRGEQGIISRLVSSFAGFLDALGFTPAEQAPGVEFAQILQPEATVRISGAGGADVGAVVLDATIPPAPSWSNPDAAGSVDRSQPLTLTFQPVAGEGLTLEVFGFEVDGAADAAVGFRCAVRAGAGSFTIPAEVLNRLPATHPSPSRPNGLLGLALRSGGTAQSVAGLDYATATAYTVAVEEVEYR